MSRVRNSKEWSIELETRWAAALRGASLVTECAFDDDELEHAIEFLAHQLRRNSTNAVIRNNPAIFAVAFTQLGNRRWSEGNFYKNVTEELQARTSHFPDADKKVKEIIRYFPSTLQRFRLATFDNVNFKRRWVIPVLLHGAIPLDHLDELLLLLSRHLKGDHSLTGESFVEAIRTRPNLIEREPKALQYFLLHGGEFSADYVSRIMDHAAGRESSLPRHIKERLDEYLFEIPDHTFQSINRVQRPTFAITPEGAIILRLPPATPEHGRSITWLVKYGSSTEEFRCEIPYSRGASQTEEAIFYLPRPELAATVILDDSSIEVSLIDRENPTIIFDETGQLISRSGSIKPGLITLMWPKTDQATRPHINGSPVIGEDLDTPFGWSSWAAVRIEVHQNDELQFHKGSSRKVSAQTQRAQLVLDAPLPGVTTLDHQSVFAEMPTISIPSSHAPNDWTYSATSGTGKILAEGRLQSNSQQLFDETFGFAGKLTIKVRGPLGKGFEQTIAVVTGLAPELTPPRRTLSSNGGLTRCEVTLRRNEFVEDRHVLEPHQRTTTRYFDGFAIRVSPPTEEFRLVDRGENARWNSKQESITHDQLRKKVLQVRGLEKGTPVQVLFESSTITQHSPLRKAALGSVELSLESLLDTANIAGIGNAYLVIGSRHLPVFSVRPDVLVEFGNHSDTHFTFTSHCNGEVQFTAFQELAPWKPGFLLETHGNRVFFPANFSEGGPLRVICSPVDDWGLQKEPTFPALGADTARFDLKWEVDSAPSQDREIMAVLAGWSAAPSPTAKTIDYAINIAVSYLSDLDLPFRSQQELKKVFRNSPKLSVARLATASLRDEDCARILIWSGLVNSPLSRPAEIPLYRLAQIAPVLGLLIAAEFPKGRIPQADDFVSTLANTFGEQLHELWYGNTLFESNEGAWNGFLAEVSPIQIKEMFKEMGVVPNSLLSGDTRILTSSTILSTASRKQVISPLYLETCVSLRKVLEDHHPSIWEMVRNLMSEENFCLPAASIALALVSRIAARGNIAAQEASRRFHFKYVEIANLAPKLALIDLIRAEAALIGVYTS